MGEPQIPGSGSGKKKRDGRKQYCKLCSQDGHKTDDCPKWTENKCPYCQHPGHKEEDCWNKHPEKRPDWWGKPRPDTAQKRPHLEETNEGEDEQIICYATVGSKENAPVGATSVSAPSPPAKAGTHNIISPTGKKEEISFDESEAGQHFNFKNNVSSYSGIDELLLYYDWIANSVTTSHVCRQREAFTTFQPLKHSVPIAGVGGIITYAAGIGNVKLVSRFESGEYNIILEDVLYVPGNRNNLFSLGRWGNAGHKYIGGEDLTLITEQGIRVAEGILLENNLYKIKFQYVRKLLDQLTHVNIPIRSWESWHRIYGHIAYDGLRKLYDRKLVTGFLVDTNSPTPDCIACTEAKLSQCPFGPPSE